jgi:FkbM family methyltransferase
MPDAAHRMPVRLRRLLERAGLQVGRRVYTLAGAREGLLRNAGLELVIDVGAHAGEYGRVLRAEGYSGRIVSLEPVGRQFEQLLATSVGDPGWICLNLAAGRRPGAATINISGNEGFSSSLLKMGAAHVRAASASGYERTETIKLLRLDDALAECDAPTGAAYLKVDTQGYEHEVLAGAGLTLPRCRAVELELSLATLYEGQLLIGEMIELMRQHGFRPTHLEPEFIDPQTGELLQVNGLFQRVGRDAGALSR